MCGIAGIFSLNPTNSPDFNLIYSALSTMNKRGPDEQNVFINEYIALAHARLSIIDTSKAASQPFIDKSNRYVIVYNGEIFNFKELRAKYFDSGFNFKSNGDTEVLLYLYIKFGEDFLQFLNGFFALAIYDKIENSLFIARDRFGIKPLIFFMDEYRFIFASELKAIINCGIPKEINKESLYTYLQLNYISSPHTILKGVQKLEPGNYIKIKGNFVNFHKYYQISIFSEDAQHTSAINYDEAKIKLRNLLSDSVERRLISDVPLGTFLSGGIDSTIITAIAASKVNDLKTFTIGFKDEPFFDESHYANIVAKKYKTNHTVFNLSTDEIIQDFFEILDYIDEPFADSSALAVNILCKHTKNNITVALSGDGADEMLGGYNKHAAEFIIRNNYLKSFGIKALFPLICKFPKSRNSFIGNKIRQIERYYNGMKLDAKSRYWLWCSIASESSVDKLLINSIDKTKYLEIKNYFSDSISNDSKGLNDVFLSDMKLVLVGDMLTKVDLMSMSRSLEVRVPFLDYTIVDFLFNLPSQYKIDRNSRKKILKDAFVEEIPKELLQRRKHGFEVPLLKWFRNELYDVIFNDLLSENLINEQQLFNYQEINNLKKQLMSKSIGDSVARIYALLVFQYWWKKYFK